MISFYADESPCYVKLYVRAVFSIARVIRCFIEIILF